MNKISKFNRILAVVLVAQLVLLAVQALWPEGESRASGEALLAGFDPAAVTQITIHDAGEKQIVLKKDDDNWVLPDYGNYQAESSRVGMMLQSIKALRTDRLITRSNTSHRRLKVSADEYERLIELQSGDTTHKLYLGTSSGGGTIHVRLDDQAPVYLVSGITTTDASTQPSAWIDTTYFSVPSDQITSLALHNANGDFEFTKNGDTWTMAGLEPGETLNQDALTTLLGQVATLRMSEPIGTELQDTYGMDAPQATITLRVREQVVTPTATPSVNTTQLMTATPDPNATPEPTPEPEYVENEYTLQIGAALDKGVVVKSSTSDYYVLVTPTTADRFIKKARTDFIAPPPTPTPEPTLAPDEGITLEPPISAAPTATTPAETATPVAPAQPEASATPDTTSTPGPASGS